MPDELRFLWTYFCNELFYAQTIPGIYDHGSHRDWKSGKTWENGKAFSSQGKVREFCQDWKSQGILPKILEKQENLNKKNVFCESQGILHKMLENQYI